MCVICIEPTNILYICVYNVCVIIYIERERDIICQFIPETTPTDFIPETTPTDLYCIYYIQWNYSIRRATEHFGIPVAVSDSAVFSMHGRHHFSRMSSLPCGSQAYKTRNWKRVVLGLISLDLRA